MLQEIENLGPAQFIVMDRFGELRTVEPGETVMIVGPARGRLIDGNKSSYRCSPVNRARG